VSSGTRETFWIALAATLLIAVVQTWEKYQQATYDRTLADTFDVRFKNIREDRKEAARTIRKNKDCLDQIRTRRKELSRIDDTLDFFDDMGFYVKAGRLSPEMAYQYFYHWVRGYYLNAERYIEAWRTEEPRRWEHVVYLFRMTATLERSAKNEDLEEFLDEETEDEE
jgi:hypothetical protein